LIRQLPLRSLNCSHAGLTEQPHTGDNGMREVIVQGRGGQGAQTAGNLLARHFLRRVCRCSALPAMAARGAARRSVRTCVSRTPIRVRCDIERADAILCFDASLLEGRLLAAADAHADRRQLGHDPAHFAAVLPGRRVLPIDGLAIARAQGLGRIVNSALLGALAQALGGPDLDGADAHRGGAGTAPARGEHRRRASGWQAMAAQRQEARP
jgi:pyruvate ferredoxin oxidoreductase gamma subunit